MKNYFRKNFKFKKMYNPLWLLFFLLMGIVYLARKKTLYIPLGVVIFLLIGIFYLSSIPSVRADWVLATTVKTEAFTELYFENHLGLPSMVKLHEPYSFSFTIHNLENQDLIYPYIVYIDEGNGQKQILEQNSVTVQNKEYITVQEGFILSQDFKREKVIVLLTAKNEQINFWIQNVNPPVTPKKKVKKRVVHKTPLPTPTISVPTLSAAPLTTPTGSATNAASASATKQYGGWYWVPSMNKDMVWLGKDSNGQDIWSNTQP